MKFDETVKMLISNGWDVECESPLEIRERETGSFATGTAAQLVIDSLIEETDKDNEVIEEIAKEFVKNNNENNHQTNNIETLFDFGSLGLRTPKELVAIFYYTFKNKGLI